MEALASFRISRLAVASGAIDAVACWHDHEGVRRRPSRCGAARTS